MAVSARALEGTISRIFGFAVLEMSIDPKAPISLLDLATEETVDAYIDWQLDSRCNGEDVASQHR
jgi:hypothetical protein